MRHEDAYDYPRPSLISRLVIFLASALILCNYYYLYAFDFEQGSTSGAGPLAIIRAFAILLLCSQLFTAKVRTSVRVEELSVITFLLFGIFVMAFKSSITSTGDWMFSNTLICALPILALKREVNPHLLKVFFESCLIILLLQIVIEFFIYVGGLSLWENKAFIGGLGNPSSFGIICNVFVAYVLFNRAKSAYSMFAFIILSAGVIMTSSMLPTLLLVLVTTIWGVLRSGFKFAILCGCAAVMIILFSEQIFSDHLRYKLDSIIGVLGETQDEGSASVSIRMQIHKDYVQSVSEDFPGFLLYGFSERFYKGVDSQIITYLSSFGLLAAALFWFYAIKSFFRALALRSDLGAFLGTTILIFMISFTSNRILDYYPMALFFFLACVTAASSSARETTVIAARSISGVPQSTKMPAP